MPFGSPPASLMQAAPSISVPHGASPCPPPPPSALSHLRPSNWAGALVVAESLALTGGALWLSSRHSPLMWAAGQLLLALSLVQWFAVLHECGHETLFRSK